MGAKGKGSAARNPKNVGKYEKPGQPTKFGRRIVMRILALAQDPTKTDEDIAREVGISRSTLLNWKGNHPTFLSAFSECRNVANELVEEALFRRAVGYTQPAVKFFFDKTQNKVTMQPYTEYFPPDTEAAKFFLRNRSPKKWRDANRNENTGAGGGPMEANIRFVVEDLTTPPQPKKK